MKSLSEISTRIERVRKELGMRKQGIAEFLQIVPSAYTQILNRGEISETHLYRLRDEKNVNPNYIKFGDEPILFKTRTHTFTIDLTNVKNIQIEVLKNQDSHPTQLCVKVEYC